MRNCKFAYNIHHPYTEAVCLFSCSEGLSEMQQFPALTHHRVPRWSWRRHAAERGGLWSSSDHAVHQDHGARLRVSHTYADTFTLWGCWIPLVVFTFLFCIQAQADSCGGEKAHQLQILCPDWWQNCQPSSWNSHWHWGHSSRVVCIDSTVITILEFITSIRYLKKYWYSIPQGKTDIYCHTDLFCDYMDLFWMDTWYYSFICADHKGFKKSCSWF